MRNRIVQSCALCGHPLLNIGGWIPLSGAASGFDHTGIEEGSFVVVNGSRSWYTRDLPLKRGEEFCR